jgi:transposase
MTSSQFPVEKWDDADMLTRARKIRIHPSQAAKNMLKQWMGARRYVYNKCLAKIRQGEQKNFKYLRNKYVTLKSRVKPDSKKRKIDFDEESDNEEKDLDSEDEKEYTINPEISEWEAKIPKDIRAEAIRDLIKNYKTAFANLKNNNIDGFHMSFCRKKDAPSMMVPLSAFSVQCEDDNSKKKKKQKENIPRSALEMENAKKKAKKDSKISTTKKRLTITKEDGGFYLYSRDHPIKIKIKKRNLRKPIILEKDCRIKVENGAWYLIAPYQVKPTFIPAKEVDCAIDPGSSPVFTIYSETCVSQIKLLNKKNEDIIDAYVKKIDKMRSLRDKKKILKYRVKKKERDVKRRIDNLIDELHHKTINYLTKTYQTIILPPFETQDMVKKSRNRFLNRNLLQLKHYQFLQRLGSKCELRGRTMINTTEEFTSKTCTACGYVKYNLGSAKVYRCDSCGIILDRDVNGARNIYIKYKCNL